MNLTIERIAVVGAGTMGSGIAQVFAQAGRAVRLIDASSAALDRARGVIARSLAKFVEKGKVTAADRDATLARITIATALDAVADADYVVEAIVEERAAKCALFSQLDTLVGTSVILASNTSSISVTEIGASTSRPDRVLGMHFMNPAPLMVLVELVRGRATSSETMTVAAALCARLGKTPVESADAPGFIANRILMPMINEAAFALMANVGTREAIDDVMKLGMGHPMGPLALADLIGLDVCVAILGVLQDGFGDSKYRACPLLTQMVAEGRLGRKTGRGFYSY
jgi:3-hydroxybutyryl-CoA dehydrogenase